MIIHDEHEPRLARLICDWCGREYRDGYDGESSMPTDMLHVLAATDLWSDLGVHDVCPDCRSHHMGRFLCHAITGRDYDTIPIREQAEWDSIAYNALGVDPWENGEDTAEAVPTGTGESD